MFYSGPISSILTQGNNLEDVDPRRRLTTRGLKRKINKNGQSVQEETDIPVEINGEYPIIAKLSGVGPRLPVELTIIYYGTRLRPVN